MPYLPLELLQMVARYDQSFHMAKLAHLSQKELTQTRARFYAQMFFFFHKVNVLHSCKFPIQNRKSTADLTVDFAGTLNDFDRLTNCLREKYIQFTVIPTTQQTSYITKARFVIYYTNKFNGTEDDV